MSKTYVQYGCGLTAPKEWTNFDVSPTIKIQKIPILGSILKSKLNAVFPDNIVLGDIIKGLPIEDNSCDGLYCSHTLEHLSLDDFRAALQNSYKVLKPGGIFRCIVPDLEAAARTYVQALDSGAAMGNMDFMNETMLGVHQRPRGLRGLVNTFFGNSKHLWMWDRASLSAELASAGFKDIRPCQFNDCEDPMFAFVEESPRFERAVAIECRK